MGLQRPQDTDRVFHGDVGDSEDASSFKQRRGADFTLADFHERLLKVGNMPPSLMEEGLMATLDGAAA